MIQVNPQQQPRITYAANHPHPVRRSSTSNMHHIRAQIFTTKPMIDTGFIRIAWRAAPLFPAFPANIAWNVLKNMIIVVTKMPRETRERIQAIVTHPDPMFSTHGRACEGWSYPGRVYPAGENWLPPAGAAYGP